MGACWTPHVQKPSPAGPRPASRPGQGPGKAGEGSPGLEGDEAAVGHMIHAGPTVVLPWEFSVG